MRLVNRIKKIINKIKTEVTIKEFIFICLFSLMWSFNLFIFNQFDVMLHNQAEFGVVIKEVIFLFVWRTLLITMIVVLAFTILRAYSKTKFTYTAAFFIGTTLAGYAQVLFMNKEELMTLRGSMDLETIPQFILNFVIYIAITFAPLMLVIYEKKKNKVISPKLGVLTAIVVLSMQTMGVITASAAAPKPASNNELYYFSVEEQLKLSKKDNIVVFILDRLDNTVSDKIFEKNESIKDIFDGFTYYRNNTSEYPGTFPSIPSMLTSKIFDKQTVKQKTYLKEGWDEEILFENLQEKDYIVNGLMDSITTFYDFKDIEEKFNNVRMIDAKNRRIKGNSFYHAMFSFSQIRQSPDVIKDWFINDRYLDIANYCIDVKNSPDYFPRTISASSDLYFYNHLLKTGLSAEEEKNVLSIIHLMAAHNPFMYNENLELIRRSNRSDMDKMVSQTIGSFKILNEYFNQMKRLNIYDDSTIILLGDHGLWGNKLDLNYVPTTSLFIKPKGQGSATMEINNTAQLSHRNFAPTILEVIGANDKKKSPSYYDIIAQGGEQVRYFYYVRWTNLNSCVYICTYEIKGDAKEISNWKKIAE